MKLKTKLSILSLSILTSLYTYANDKTINTPKEIETIEVIAVQDSGIKITTSKLVKLPGTGNDPIKGLEALPGVILSPPRSGGPIAQPAVRGSAATDNLYLTDGVEMGYIFHNDGQSIYHPDLINSFELLTGAWSPQYADATGGVIVSELRDPDGQNPSSSLDLGFFRSGFLYEQGLSKNAAFYLSFRESLVHTYVDNFIEDEDFSFATPPRNRDYQGKLIYDIDEQNVVRILLTGAKDYIEIDFDADGRDIAKNPDLASGERYQTYFHNQSISIDTELDDFQLKNTLSVMQRNQQDREGDIFNWYADINTFSLRSNNSYYLPDSTLFFGGEVKAVDVDYEVSGRLLPCNTEFEMCLPSYVYEKYAEANKFDYNYYQVYANLSGDFNDELRYEFGANVARSSLNNETVIEPRANLFWDISDINTLRLGVGRHHKWIDDYRLLTGPLGNQLLAPVSTDQIVMGLDSNLASGWKLRAEAYYKNIDNLAISNPDYQQRTASTSPAYLSHGTGKAYGVEFLANKRFGEKWFGWASIALTKTERENELTGQIFNSEFDLPVVANIVVDYQINERWKAGFKWRYQSGKRYTDVTQATPFYEGENDEPLFYVPQYGEFNGQTLKDYHRLDVRVDYQTSFYGLESLLYFEVLNVYGSRAIQEFEYAPDYQSYEKDYQFPDMPLPAVGWTIYF